VRPQFSPVARNRFAPECVDDEVDHVRVLIADDHPLFAKTLEALLSGTPEIEVVGTAADGLEAVALALGLSPDVILMDVEMPQLDGIAAARRVRDLGLDAAALLLSASDDRTTSQRALEAGAAGFLTKERLAYTLVPAILATAAARDRLNGDGGAELAGRARVG
jgi:DNA-binding NarL/FixJ family response regulator